MRMIIVAVVDTVEMIELGTKVEVEVEVQAETETE